MYGIEFIDNMKIDLFSAIRFPFQFKHGEKYQDGLSYQTAVQHVQQ